MPPKSRPAAAKIGEKGQKVADVGGGDGDQGQIGAGAVHLGVEDFKPSKRSIAAQILDILRDADRLMGLPSIRYIQ